MKTTKWYFWIVFVILVSVSLAACTGGPGAKPAAAAQDSTASQVEGQAAQDDQKTQVSDVEASAGNWVEEVPQVDKQGSVEIEIIPVKLNYPGSTLDFKVSMNTHSVDLSMNLAELATLSTDTGKTVQATQWDAPAGGHHVSGKLTFPSSVDGAPLLDGVKKLTLTLNNIDAPKRIFVWEK
jgi:hypothetical protein